MSDRYNPRKDADSYYASRTRSKPRAPRDFSALPDPPDNPEFEALPEAVQERFSKRFNTGIKLTEARDLAAHRTAERAWVGWLARCHANRLREREQYRRERLHREEILEQNRRRVR